MTTTRHRVRRYRFHELMFDTVDAGHIARCTCGWGNSSRPHLDEDDAHYAGAVHLGRMAWVRLQLSGIIDIPPVRRERRAGDAPPGMWAVLEAHRHELGDAEAAAVLDVVAEQWPERVGRIVEGTPYCARCDVAFSAEEWANRESAVHADERGEDVHARCCVACAAGCCVAGRETQISVPGRGPA